MESLIKHPIFRMLFIFLSVYIGLTGIYGWHVKKQLPQADLPSKFASYCAVQCIHIWDQDIQMQTAPASPKIYLYAHRKNIISVSESCNGVSTLIIYISLVASIASQLKRSLVFLVLGISSIWIANCMRIVALYFISINHHTWFTFLHETLFPLIIYAIAFTWYMLFAKKSIQVLKEKNVTF